MSTQRTIGTGVVVLAALMVAGASQAQVSGTTDQSTHIGGSTGTGQTGTGGPIAPSDMHAPAGAATGGSTGTGKTSRHGRKAPRGMHAPTGPTMGGSLGTGKTGNDAPSPKSQD